MKRFVLLLLVGAAACTEQATAPGVCPDFCPGGQIEVADTILLDVIERDSAFRGYFQPHEAEAMTVAEAPGVVDSRAIFLLNAIETREIPNPGDTVPITADSSRLRLVIVRRDTAAINLRLKIYRLPLTIDSTTTFAQLDSSFNATPVDSVNLSDLLTRPLLDDSATLANWGGRAIRTDSAGHTLQIAADSSLILFFDFDTTQTPLVVADSGRLAYGVRVSADSLPSVSIGANDICNCDPQIRWFYHFTVPDTLPAPDSVAFKDVTREVLFDSFVFDPPNAPIDDHLTVGGAPSARSLVRVAFPSFLRDSFDIVRATVLLVPVSPVPAFAGDSFRILARPILTDVGAKSPLSLQAPLFGRASLAAGSTDTVRLELSDLVRVWARDTSIATAFIIGGIPEAASSAEVRFYSSRSAFKPALHVTYVKRFPFGTP